MVKLINVSQEKLTVNGVETTHIGSFSKKELREIIQSGIVDVYLYDEYVARMTLQDYREYSEKFGVPVEDKAYELLQTQKEELLQKYPGSSIQAIIGYVLAQELYNAGDGKEDRS